MPDLFFCSMRQTGRSMVDKRHFFAAASFMMLFILVFLSQKWLFHSRGTPADSKDDIQLGIYMHYALEVSSTIADFLNSEGVGTYDAESFVCFAMENDRRFRLDPPASTDVESFSVFLFLPPGVYQLDTGSAIICCTSPVNKGRYVGTRCVVIDRGNGYFYVDLVWPLENGIGNLSIDSELARKPDFYFSLRSF
ncbi:MAG: hypothetical protein RBU25_06875 [Lentisphaeria bacterium]|jgi:hypothetical protein|nr:hypothetical protein [Lentisphaeria bacterium]